MRLTARRHKKHLVVVTETDLEQSEKVSTEQVPMNLFLTEANDEAQRTARRMRERDVMLPRSNRAAVSSAHQYLLAAQDVDAETLGEFAIEHGTLGARIQVRQSVDEPPGSYGIRQRYHERWRGTHRRVEIFDIMIEVNNRRQATAPYKRFRGAPSGRGRQRGFESPEPQLRQQRLRAVAHSRLGETLRPQSTARRVRPNHPHELESI